MVVGVVGWCVCGVVFGAGWGWEVTMTSDLPSREAIKPKALRLRRQADAANQDALVPGLITVLEAYVDGRLADVSAILRVPCPASTCEDGEKVHGGHAGTAPIERCIVCRGRSWVYPDPPEWYGDDDRPWWPNECDLMWRVLGLYEYGGDDDQ